MAVKAKFKLGTGDQINFEKDADAVTYGAKKLSSALTAIDSESATPFGKQLAATDKEEFCRMLEITPEVFWDEAQNKWTGGLVRLTTNNAKIGNTAVYCPSGDNLHLDGGLILGGQPFTISFFLTSPNAEGTAFTGPKISVSLGLSTSWNTNDTRNLYFTVNSSQTSVASTVVNNTSLLVNKAHIEFGYDGAKMYCFLNGSLKKTQTVTIARTGYKIQLGGSINCYFDEFRALDGVCEHTAAFSVPTAPYTLTDETVALMHFE